MLRFAAAFAIAAVATTPVYAAACRDANGKFIKCPDKKAAPAKRWKDAKGKFAKCGAAGAKPA